MINLHYARCSGFLKAVASSFVDKKDIIREIRETIVLAYREVEGEGGNENPGRIPVATVLINETV